MGLRTIRLDKAKRDNFPRLMGLLSLSLSLSRNGMTWSLGQAPITRAIEIIQPDLVRGRLRAKEARLTPGQENSVEHLS